MSFNLKCINLYFNSRLKIYHHQIFLEMKGILRGVNKDRNYFNSVVLSIVLFLAFTAQSFGQLACSNTEPETLTKPWRDGSSWQNGYPTNVWNAYVYQLTDYYNPNGANAGHNEPSEFKKPQPDENGIYFSGQYKGMLLRDGANFLPVSGVNFDTHFSDPNPGNGYLSDNLFFQTGINPTTSGGCDTQLNQFGVHMRGRYVPTQNGIYRIRIGSDDGSYFRMFSDINNPSSSGAVDVNGNNLIHNNWVKNESDTLLYDGVDNFVYENNIRNYYVELEAAQEWFMTLNYYEKDGANRLAFEIELYFGPGEIKMGADASGSVAFCGINPDPTIISSIGPAVFEDGEVTNYFWQYATSNDESATWNTISGATEKDYKIPAYEDDNWTGSRYYRRGATNTIAVNDSTSTDVDVFSNVLEVIMNPIADLDRTEFGVNEWIGHTYDAPRNFATSNYSGRVFQDSVFTQNFPAGVGCNSQKNNFTVQYRMRLDVQPGTYDFNVNGDDGYRLIINGTTVIDEWAKVGGKKVTDDTYQMEITEDGVLELILDYYEIGGDQSISFNYVENLLILPLEWGDFLGQSCGENNCLNWSTLQEKNTSHFIMEKSNNGFSWEEFGETLEAQGNSNQEVFYDYSDHSVANDVTFYRIKQVDLDDTFSYSDVIRVENNSNRNKLMPFPNPTTDLLFVDSQEGILSVELTSQDQRVRAQPLLEKISDNRYQIDMRQFPSNHYLVTIHTEKSRKTYKIMKR
ncbi:Putative aggregation factor core protein MAFp3, isoform C [Cyclobacterium amurskyense]|uniref:Putative aggregation factor core protein MAFp3, isoform C n=2 Tax=Cyclobacterium amurskyense TaxID=320787 RepID=A0A0H4P928_9BACT|nr:Putative aggregation factor core protein MAFp3, isoform C [Cyclobacterium amurskyense]